LADPGRIERVPQPVLIDEWQREPYVWDLVRRSVDRDYSPGRFLLTGSATPTEAPTHSGAGRIVRLRMRPMSLAGRGVAVPSVSLADLLTGERPPVGGSSPMSLQDYADEVVRSGLPAVRTLPDRVRRAQLDGYLSKNLSEDGPRAEARSPSFPLRRNTT
jgi:predicted AAA+ superfamily ATPase